MTSKAKSRRCGESTMIHDDDRLSHLPEVIIAKNLSLVPIESAVSTSVLSKSWCNRWTQLSSLKLNKNYGNDFFAVANSVIIKLSSQNLKSVKLHNIPSSSRNTSCGYFMDVWIPLICNPSLKVLSMSVEEAQETTVTDATKPPSLPLPSSIFLCQSLVTLKLESGFKFRLPVRGETISLPNLLKLFICLPLKDDDQLEIMTKLLKSCPLLRQLSVKEDGYVKENHVSEKERHIAIVGKKLERLILWFKTPYVINSVTIDTPNLVNINITDKSFAAYNFAEIPKKLAVAWLSFSWPKRLSFNSRYQSLHYVQSISSVREFSIMSFTLHAHAYLEKNALPLLEQLRIFRAYLKSPSCCHDLMRFLERCPNVEALKFRLRTGRKCIEAMDDIQPADCLLTKVKTIKIPNVELKGNDGQSLVLVKYMLSNAKILELLHLCVEDEEHPEEGQMGSMIKEQMFCEELKKFPRSSADCQIVFLGKYFTLKIKSGEIVEQLL